jgi:hypothetical protein
VAAAAIMAACRPLRRSGLILLLLLSLGPLAGCKALKGDTSPRPAVYDDPGGGM